MGGAHRLDAHAYDCRVVTGADGGVRTIRFRIVTSPRLDITQLETLASLRRPSLTPVARMALGCLGVLAIAVTVVAHGHISAPDLPVGALVTATQLPLPVRAVIGPTATVEVLDPPVLTPAPQVVSHPRPHRVTPTPRVTPTTEPDAPPKKSKKHSKGDGQ